VITGADVFTMKRLPTVVPSGGRLTSKGFAKIIKKKVSVFGQFFVR